MKALDINPKHVVGLTSKNCPYGGNDLDSCTSPIINDEQSSGSVDISLPADGIYYFDIWNNDLKKNAQINANFTLEYDIAISSSTTLPPSDPVQTVKSIEDACISSLHLTKDQFDQNICTAGTLTSQQQESVQTVKPLEDACTNALHLTKDQCDLTIRGAGSVLLCIPPSIVGRAIESFTRAMTNMDISCR
jgi:hypothetical protein